MINKMLATFIGQLAILLLGAVLVGSLLAGCMDLSDVTSESTTSTTASTTTKTATETTTATASDITETARPSRPAETTLVLRLEEEEEKVAAKLFTSDLGYSMYLEADRYSFTVIESQIDKAFKADQFIPVDVIDVNTEMFLEIGHLPHITKDDALVKMKTQLISRFPSLMQEGDIGVGVNKLDASVLRGINGSDWDSEAFMSAVFSDGDDGVYYSIIFYFFQASEGYASRFNQYLDTFQVD